MNKVILMGRLTRDPETRYSQNENGTSVARFSLAVDRRFKRNGDAEADFFNCTSFGKQAEFVDKYLKQGTKIVLTGRIQNDNYTNKEGQKVYGMQIVAEEIEFAESKNSQNNSDRSGSAQRSSQQTGGRSSAAAEGGFMNIPSADDEELPFSF